MAHPATRFYPNALLAPAPGAVAGSTGGSVPRRKPKRTSEQADPSDSPPAEYEEPAEDLTPTPDEAVDDEPEFDEPSDSLADEEFPEPTR